MAEEKEWTSLSGCVKKEGLSNEQKFVLLTFRPNDRLYAKDMSDQEVTEKLVSAIYNVAAHQTNPKAAIRNVIDVLEYMENKIKAVTK